MSRKFYRRGPWRRLLSSFLVVAFTLSFTGVGFAEPAEPEAPADVAAPTADTQAPTADATPPQEEPAPVAEPAPASDPPPVEPSVEPAPQSDSPELAKNGRGPTGGTADEHAAPAGNDAAPTDVVADPAPSVTAAAVTAAGGSVSIELEGWRTTPSSEWSKGNLGTLWNEGDWVQYRVIIDNSGGDAVVNYGAFSLIYDHLNSNKNAIGVDMTRDWHIYYTPTQPDDSDPRTHSGSGISPSAQDVGFPSGSPGSADFLKTSFPAGTAVIPAGQYAVVMFEAHLSITAWWQQQSPARFGSSYYPGSSMQMRVESPSGAKTVPIPIPPKPAGYVDGVKFNDYDHDGVRDAGEPGLAGWEFHLHDGPAGFPLDLHATSAADGSFTFGPLPGATYSLSEVAQANWTNSTPLPMTIVVPSGSRVATDVGNYHSDVTKTWELSVSNVPAGASFFVRYSVNGQTKPDKALTGSGPYTGSDTNIPYGASVDTSYYASYAGETLFLGHQGPETLTSNFTNRFSWDSSVSGHKFGDVNANGRWDTGTTELGLSGWSIDLYRLPAAGGSPVLYTSQLTGAGGAYSFTDVLPGTYYVRENLTGKTGWFQTTPNPSNFGVSAADRTESGLNFGNVEVRAAIDIEKTGPTLAHEGDTITYSFTLQNIGNTTLTGVTANDPLLGGIIFGPVTLASSESTTFSRTYVVPSPRETVDNTVTAFGYDLLQGMVSDFDTWQVDVIHPAISIAKTVDFDGNGAFSDSEMGYAGDTAVWRLLVSNTGDVALADVMVTDTNGSNYGPYSLGVGASRIITYTAVITADKTNSASTSGRDALRLTVNAGPDSAAVDVIDPDIDVEKTVDADGNGSFHDSEVAYPGATALWKIIVRNTGDVTLTAVTLTDSNGHSFPAPFTLGPGASREITYTTPVTADVDNLVLASGTDPLGNPVDDEDTASVDLIAPALSIAKTVDFNGDGTFSDSETYYKGSAAVWRIIVTNTGDVPVYDIQVTDSNHSGGPVVGTFDLLTNGASREITYTETINADKVNSASAEGLDQQENPVSAGPDTASVDAIDPDIQIAKTVDFNADGVFHDSETYYSGAPALWRIEVTNSGDVTLTAVTITDSNGHSFPAPFTLAAGASRIITYTTNPTSDTRNDASVSAKDPLNGDVGARDSASVDTISTGLTVAKTVDFNDDGTYSEHETYYVGEIARWQIAVTNTSDVTLTAVTLTDPALSAGDFWASIGPGQTVYANFPVAANADTTNTAYVSAIDPLGATLNRQDDASVDVIDPGLSVTKTVDYDGDGTYSDYEDGLLGATAHWMIVVRNTGDVPMTNVTVSDSNGQDFGPVTLAAGASQTFTYDTVPTGYTLNTANAYGTDPLGGQYGPASGTAAVQPYDPSIELVKSAMPGTILSGDMVTYYYRVTNTSTDSRLFDIVVTDNRLGTIGTIDELAPLGVSTLTTTVPIAVDTSNDATATGWYAFGNEPESVEDYDGRVSDGDDAFVDVVHPALSIAKTVEFNGDGTYGEDETALSGSLAKWRIVVLNSGDVPLTSVVVTDTNGQSFGPFDLAAGASRQFDYNTNPTANTVNVASATGTYTAPGYDTQGQPRKVGPVTDSAQVRVFLPFTPPDLAIVKSADATQAAPGQTVVYTLTYSNVGKGAASNFTIVDDFDERYVTITDAGGGTVAGGKITWNIAGPLYAGESGSISYTVRISDTMPSGTTNIDNVVVITHPDDPNPDNNRDDWRVVVAFLPFTEPFLPFTGGEMWVLLYVGVALAAAGVLFRRLGNQEA